MSEMTALILKLIIKKIINEGIASKLLEERSKNKNKKEVKNGE